MKRSIALLFAICLAATVKAAPLNVVEVTAMDVDCLFSTTCTPTSTESVTAIPIPGAIGSAFLRTHVIRGDDLCDARGLWGYLYCLDLQGCAPDPNHEPCFTNVVRCVTNQVDCITNQVVCRTNVHLTNVLVCITNRLPATNIVCCITNRIPGGNVSQCFPTHHGDRVCCEGTFPATNVVFCCTNSIPARDVVICTPAFGWVTNRVCTTNAVPGVSNVVTCTTNRVPCEGTGPCVRSLSINFGRVVGTLDFNSDTLRDQAFLLGEGFGNVVPSSVSWSNGVVTIHFDPPICPGEASFCIGLVSSNAPCDVRASVRLESGQQVTFSTRGPCPDARPITCDFSRLRAAINQLADWEIIAPTASSRAGRKATLLSYLSAARAAADAGNKQGVLDALNSIIAKIDGGKNDWVTAAAARRLSAIINDILACLDRHPGDDGHDQDDDDDGHDNDEDGHDGDGDGHDHDDDEGQ